MKRQNTGKNIYLKDRLADKENLIEYYNERIYPKVEKSIIKGNSYLVF